MTITWNGKGLPPVGAEIETRIDFDKAPPYVLANLAELGVDIRKHVPKFQRGIVAYCSKKYLVIFSPDECLVPMSCVELRQFVSAEQIAEEAREKAIDRLMGLAPEISRKAAEVIYDAEIVKPVK